MKRIVRRLFSLLLSAMMCAGALAEGMPAFDGHFGSEKWKKDESELIWVCEPEEGVRISACLGDGEIVALTVEFPCDNETDAVWQALDFVGMDVIEEIRLLEDDTSLTAGGYEIARIHGEARDAYQIHSENYEGELLYQPVHGGEKLHSRVECSGMDVSRIITEEAAEEIGWDRCETCF